MEEAACLVFKQGAMAALVGAAAMEALRVDQETHLQPPSAKETPEVLAVLAAELSELEVVVVPALLA